MKRKMLAALLVAACLVCSMLALAACGNNKLAESKYLGMWNATTAEYSGTTTNVKDLMDEFSIELKGDGGVVAKVNGTAGNGQWDETETGIVLKGTDTGDLTFTDEDGKLCVDYNGAKIVFEKTQAQAADK